MNKLLRVLGAGVLSLFPFFASSITTETGKTFFVPQPLGMQLEPLNFQFRDFAARHEAAEHFTISVAPFYIESTDPAAFRRAYMPAGKNMLVVKGSQAPAPDEVDISATWLKIGGTNAVAELALMRNEFSSLFTIAPRYSVYGASLGIHKKIGRVFVHVAAPLTEMQTNLGLQEFIQGGNVDSIDQINVYDPMGGGGGMQENPSILYSANVTEALGKDYWRFNKLSAVPLKAAGLGDTALRVGLEGEVGELFVSAVFPTSKRPTNAYVFEPLLGNGSHFGLGMGGALKLSKEIGQLLSTVSLRGELDYTYLFENEQVRTFDLVDKGPLSRYLLFKQENPGRGIDTSRAWHPGVNILSKKCAVTPGSGVHFGLHGAVQHNKLRAALHYQFVHQQQEGIRLREEFDKTFAISHTAGNDGLTAASFYYPEANINLHGDNQGYLVGGGVFADPLTLQRLDVHSATRPALLQSGCFVTLGFEDAWHGKAAGVGLTAGVHMDHASHRLSSWLLGSQLHCNF